MSTLLVPVVLVPLIVRVEVPGVPDPSFVKVRILALPGIMGFALNTGVMPVGVPVTLRVTGSAKLKNAPISTVALPLLPPHTVWAVGVATILKSGIVGATISKSVSEMS